MALQIQSRLLRQGQSPDSINKNMPVLKVFTFEADNKGGQWLRWTLWKLNTATQICRTRTLERPLFYNTAVTSVQSCWKIIATDYGIYMAFFPSAYVKLRQLSEKVARKFYHFTQVTTTWNLKILMVKIRKFLILLQPFEHGKSTTFFHIII